MNKMIRLKSTILILLSLILISGSVFGQGYRNGMKEGVVRVKFSPQISATLNNVKPSSVGGVLQTGIQAFDRVSSQLSAVEMKRIFPYSPRHEAKHKKYGLDLWYEVKYTSGVNPQEAIAGYSTLQEVSLAEPIWEKSLVKGEVKYAPAPSSAGEPFSDPYLSKQWHYNNTGDQVEVSVKGADINLYKAWEVETGKPNVVVCVVDGGIDTDHEDLAANMWINQAENNGEPGVDDDGNGYKDDIYGYNFADDGSMITDHFHGTHVAGTIAAVNNNGLGVAGVAGGSGNNDGVRLMSAQIFTEDGGSGGYPAAIAYGADNGAVISQNSWGYTKAGVKEQAIHDAIDYFIAEAGKFAGSPMKGGIVIFAAGNFNSDGEWYPGYYESALAVSALGPDLKKASYSNYGTWLDIAAPGGNVDYGKDHGVLSTLPEDKYGFLDGTSMACPHVSGVAALVVSKYGAPTFTVEELRTHLLSGTHDIDENNPDYAGKLGIGYTDAWLALQKDNEIAPAPVADLTLLGIAQDFANLSWTVPADEDDGQPLSFEMLYSSEAITEDNAGFAEKVKMNNSRDTVGAPREIEIQELEPTTTYNFAVRSIDRWGNVSKLSNIVSETTNQGPAINTDQELMDFTIDAASATTADGNFTILNEADGVLKWEGFTRHKKHKLSYNSTHLNYPVANPTAEIGQENIDQIQLMEETREGKEDAITPMASADPLARFYDEYDYCNGYPIVIGESDTTFTNSSAIRYHVDREIGFNLTHVEMMLQHIPATGPMIMEVYQGEELNKKNMIFAQEVTSYKGSYYWHNITLDEQLYFEKGTTFWIVFHVPSGNLYPLGMAREAEGHHSDNCLMSLNMGKSWMTLEEALENPYFAWTTVAKSKNQHLGSYITLDPSSGVIEGNGSQEVNISLDASTLINGDYQANVVLKSNDGDDKFFRMPVDLTVTGQQPVLVNDKVIDFGSVFYGHDKEMTITIKNTGYGNFNVKSAVSTDAQFTIVKKPYKISALDEAELKILYTPDGVGNANGSIDFTDKMGRTHSITLFGVAAAPSRIAVSPADVQLTDMAMGDSTNTSFTITNTGEYPLEYVIPSFAKDIEIEGMNSIHKYGYTLESNFDGDTTAVYTWNDLSEKGTELTEELNSVDYNDRYQEVALGFEFPFYGHKLESINISRYGILSMTQEGGLGNCSPPSMSSGCSPHGFITALAYSLDLNKGGKILYAREPGKFIVEYQDVLKINTWDLTQTITFQIVMYYTGDIEFRYKDIEKLSSYNRKKALVGVCNPEHTDPFLVNGTTDNKYKIEGRLSTDETVFRLRAPGQNLITSVSEPYGMIKVGESKTIDVAVSTDDVYESNLYQRLAIVSNDPFNNPEAFTLRVNVNTGGEAKVTINKDSILMGQVFQGGERKELLVIKNDGTKDVDIISITQANNKFKITGEAPLLLKAKSSYFIDVELISVEKGVVEEVLTIETSTGDKYEVYINAEVVPAPGITVDVSPINQSLESGEMVSKTITVTNNGESDLEIVPSGSDWLYLGEAETMGMTSKNFTYYALNSDDEDGPAYNWDELRYGNGTRIDPSEMMNNGQFWQAVALPYELTFYNQLTDTIWISHEGMISMSKPTINPIFIWPDAIPNANEPNNIIAPYLAIQNFDSRAEDYLTECGIFYRIDDDRVVVEWAEYFDLFGMGSKYCYEAIIYKNGNIKFQYKTGGWSSTTHGLIGIENADGTDGVQLAFNQPFFEDGKAASLVPAQKQIIPAGETKQLNIKLDAKTLNKGTYTANFRIFNNTVQNPEVIVPVTLTVEGVPAMETTESIEYGQLMAYEIAGDFGPEPMPYFQEFAVTNSGRADLEFTNISFEDGSEAKAEIEFTDPMWGWKEWQEINSWNLPTLVPGEKAKMRIRLLPSGANAEIHDNLIFASNLPEGEFKLPVNASVILPPAMVVEQELVSVMANTPEYQENRTVVIDNSNGMSVLTYNLEIDYYREGQEQDAEASSEYMSTSIPALELLEAEVEMAGNAQPWSEEGFNTTLEYDTLTTPSKSLGFGSSSAFVTGTVFHAPADGFNLTHLKTYYAPGNVLNSVIQVEVRAGGTNIADAKVLIRENFEHNLDTPNPEGQYLNFELSESQIFYPGEKFYVVFYYPLGVAFPQGAAEGAENVPGRFLYLANEAWSDLQGGFDGHGWMVKALEKEAKGGAWVAIDGELEGELAAGDSLTVNLHFDASKALDVDNRGELTISTNDPKSSDAVVELQLRKNQGPIFELDSELSLNVNENETLSLVIPTMDIESDTCTYSLATEYDFVQMSVANDTITLVYAPDFEAAGNHVFALIGQDVHGNETRLNIPVAVINVNRAPELIQEIATREYYQDEAMDLVDLTGFFRDPDMEKLSYDYFISDVSIANIFTWDNGIMIEPKVDGEAMVTVIARDSEDLSVETTFNLTIGTITGIEDVEGELKTQVYPVPTTGPLNIVLGNELEGIINISLVNVIGASLYETIVNKTSGEHIETLNIGSLPSGIYLLNIKTENKVIVKKIIKK